MGRRWTRAASGTRLMTHSTAWRLALSAAIIVCVAGARPLSAAEVAPAASAATPAATDLPYMLDARVVGDVSRVRFIADMSVPVEAAVFGLADPYRIVIDLPEVRFVLPDGAGTTGRGMVSAFRYGLISAGKSRIVIDVSGPVAIDKQFVVPPANGQPARLVVDLVPTTRDKFLAAAKAYRGEERRRYRGHRRGRRRQAAGRARSRPRRHRYRYAQRRRNG